MSSTSLLRGGLLLAALLGAHVQAADSLVVCTEASPEGFDIVQYTAATTADASAETLFERLVAFAPGSTEIIPALAQSWSISDDGLSYTFNLRQGVKFHSNPAFTPTRPFNADDVLWSFQRQLDPDHPWHKLSLRGFPYAEAMGLRQLIERVEKLDDYRVRFVLRHPEAPFLANLAMGFASIYSAEYADQLLAEHAPERLNSQPIGTGPFIFERYAKDAQVRFRANPDYWDGAPAIDRLLLAITTEPNVRQQRLKAGDCQIALYPRPVDIPALKADARLQVLELDSLLTAYIGINPRHPPLDDVRVRQALSMAVDRATLSNTVMQGSVVPAYSITPPGTLGYEPPQVFDYDPAAARRLLAEAGYPDGEGWPGVELIYNTQEAHRKIAVAVQQMWKDELNIEVTIANQEWKVYLDSVSTMNFDIARRGWIGDYVDPNNFLDLYLSEGGNNNTGFKSAVYDDLILNKAPQARSREARYAIFREAERMLMEQMPIIPIYTYTSRHLVHPSVKGLPANLMDSLNLRYVWLDPDWQQADGEAR